MDPINPTFWQKLDHWARASTPTVSLLLLALIGVVPIPLSDYGSVAPLLPLIGVYYWAIHRPDLMPFPAVFLVGLVQDLLTGGALGVNAFVLLLTTWVVLTQRRTLAGMPVLFIWLAFAIIAAFAAAIEWAAVCALNGEIMAVRSAIYRALITGACYPIIALALHPVLRTMTPARSGV